MNKFPTSLRAIFVVLAISTFAIAATIPFGSKLAAGLSALWNIESARSRRSEAPDDFVTAVSPGDYRSAGNGSWDATASWERFDGVSWVVPAAAPTSADGLINIRTGHTITISAANVSADQVIVDGQLTIGSGRALTIANGTGTDLTVNGTVLNQGTFTPATSSSWVVSSTGTFIQNSLTSISTPLDKATLDANSNFIYRGSSSLTPTVSMSGRTYGNLSLESTSGSFSVTSSGSSPLTINGNLTIGNGVTFNIGMTGAFNIKGDITASTGSTLNFSPSGAPTMTMSGATLQTIGGAGNITFNGNQFIDVTNTTGVNLQKSLDLAGGSFSVSGSGRVNFGTSAISGTGSTFSSSASSTLGIGSPDGITTGTTLGNIRVSGVRTFTAGTTFEYNGSSNQSVGNALPASVANLAIANTGAAGSNSVTGSSSQTVTGLLRIQQGSYTGAGNNKDVQVDAGGTFNAGGTVNVSGNWSNNGTFAANSNAVVLNGASQTVNGQTSFYSLSKSTTSAATLTFESGKTQTVTNALTLTGAAANLLLLRSSVTGTRWNIVAPSSQSVDFVNVQDSGATGGSSITPTNSVDSGNNVGWNFPSTDTTETTDYFRSKVSGDWSAAATWQSSHDGITWIDATATPTSAANTITIQSGHSVDVTAAVNVDQVVISPGGSLFAEGSNLTVDDGTGTDISVAGTLGINSSITNNGQIVVNNTLQINTASPAFNGAGSISYDPSGNALLRYGGVSTLNVVGTAATIYWPVANGPQNVTVAAGSGGVDFQVSRTIPGTLSASAGLYDMQNLTLNGSFIINLGGVDVTGSPTYGPNSVLKYNSGGSFNRGLEWTQNTTSGPGYPNAVDIANNTTLNIGFNSFGGFTMGGLLTVEQGSTLNMPNLFGALTVLGGVYLDGTLNLSPQGGDLHVSGGNWTGTSNSVIHGASRPIYFDAPGDQTIFGNNTFDGLNISASAARTIKFEAGKTQTTNSFVSIVGSDGNLISLRSTVDGTQWKIVAAGVTVNYVDVKDSDATGSNSGGGITPSNSVNSGNNTAWNFPIPVTLTDFSVSPSSGSEAAQSAITLTATLAPAPTTNKTVTISIDGTGITGDDYRNSLGNITVAAGQTTGSINISINDDAFIEGPETANVHASMDGVTKDASFTIVDNDSDPPTATNLSAAESYTEDTTLNLFDIVVTDSDSTATTASLALSDPSAGSLTTATAGTTASVFNSGTGVWSASGPIAEVNALLASVSFVPAANFNSNFSIATSVTDGQSTPATGTKSITGTAVNDGPTATNLSAPETYTEDTNLNLIDIVVSDADSSTVTATLALSDPSAGTLSVGTSGTTTSSFNSGTGVWTATGPIAEVNTLLAGVSYTPTADFNGSFAVATSVSDGVATAVTGAKAITGTPVNDAPVLDGLKSPTLNTQNVDAPLPAGGVGTLVSQLVDPTVPAGQLDNVSDIDSGAMLGVAVTATDTANGSWFYSTNGGTTWNAMGIVSDSGARVLAADASTRIYFRPSAGFNGSIPAAISFRAWDQTAGLNGSVAAAAPNGGSTAFSSNTDTAGIVINAGSIEFASAAYSGVENSSITLTVNRSTSDGTSSVSYHMSDGSAAGGTCSTSGVDYQPASGTLTFGQGVSSQTITIPLCPDLVSESPAEAFTVTLDSPSGSTLGTKAAATVSIIDAASEFVSSTPISLADGLPGNPNPSTLAVDGYTASIAGLRLTLYNVTKPTSGDLSVMLVDPSGNRNFVVMTGIGGSNPLSNATITLEDSAASYMPQNSGLIPGTNYWPTSCAPDTTFAPPAPAGPHNTAGCDPTDRWTFASVFNGFNPNGTWKLYVMDEAGTPFSSISAVTGSIGGWGIQFLLPTAAPVSISGRVRTIQGEGIRNAAVTLTGGDLAEPIVVRTGTFGAYAFKNLRPGTTYVVSVSSARYTFASPVRSVSLMDDLAGMDFVSRKQE